MEKLSGVRAIERALDILECYSERQDELGVSEIARSVSLAKSTASRIIATLEQRHYLTQSINGKYRIGPKGLQLGKMFLHKLDYRNIAKPHMKDIAAETGESVSLYVKSNGNRVCIDRIESDQALRRVIQLGELMSLDRGASGKLLTAYLGNSEEKAAIPNQTELAAIVELGYAVSHGERVEGVSSVSTPIFDHTGKMITALTISGPTFRYQSPRLEEYIKIMVAHAQAISTELGYNN